MTREEAKHIIDSSEYFWLRSNGKEREALCLASKSLEQEPVIDKIRAEIIMYEGDCRLSVDEYPSCKQCTDNVFESIYAILDKYKAESEASDA